MAMFGLGHSLVIAPAVPTYADLLRATLPHPLNAGRDRRRIAIIGATPDNDLAPWDDPEWTVWGLNAMWRRHVIAGPTGPRFRADAWFELHPLSAQSPEEMDALRACPVPVYMFEAYPEVPASLAYPMAAVEGLGYRDCFACTFAYQIALAIAFRAEVIGLWGVALDGGTARERTVELASVQYWMGVAEGRGIEVVTPPGSHLAYHPRRYGYEYRQEIAWSERLLDRLAAAMYGEARDARESREADDA